MCIDEAGNEFQKLARNKNIGGVDPPLPQMQNINSSSNTIWNNNQKYVPSNTKDSCSIEDLEDEPVYAPVYDISEELNVTKFRPENIKEWVILEKYYWLKL